MHEPEMVPCGFPGGCTNRIDYTPGVGRRPKYCGRLVGRVTHTRYNAYRAHHGQLATTGEPPATRETAGPGSGAGKDDGPPRPVSRACTDVITLGGQLTAALDRQRDELAVLATRLTDALSTATDPEAAAAEVAAAHRAARARVDHADAAAADAHATARAATTEADAARVATAAAEQAAEQALAERDDALEDRDLAQRERRDALGHRDQAVEERDQARAEAAAAVNECDQLRSRLAELDSAHRAVLADHATTRAELAERTAERDHARQDAEEHHRRAAAAEQARTRADTRIDTLTQHLDAARADAAQDHDRAVALQTDFAAATAEIASLREAVARERAHAAELTRLGNRPQPKTPRARSTSRAQGRRRARSAGSGH